MWRSKRKLLKECYIFALPTRYPNEGQPISILEAMGNGMFIITTDHAGIPDIVSNENGIVLKKVDTIGNVYKQLCNYDRNRFYSICKNNVFIVEEKYTQKRYTKKIGEILLNG